MGGFCGTHSISIHAPLARCDAALEALAPAKDISIHAPLARCDWVLPHPTCPPTKFQSTHLLRGATVDMDFGFCSIGKYFNPRTSCEVRLTASAPGIRQVLFQSTHLLRGATVDMDFGFCSIGKYFNPRTSCEVRLTASAPGIRQVLFQSTHLLRGATASARYDYIKHIFQSTHLLRGATPTIIEANNYINISIHAPLARCDHGLSITRAGERISIHAPLARCDIMGTWQNVSNPYFNPRTSCEVRQQNYTKEFIFSQQNSFP